jgi:hypothetical protein
MQIKVGDDVQLDESSATTAQQHGLAYADDGDMTRPESGGSFEVIAIEGDEYVVRSWVSQREGRIARDRVKRSQMKRV